MLTVHVWDAQEKMSGKRLVANRAWDVNDPFTGLSPIQTELNLGDLCLVYFTVNCYSVEDRQENSEGISSSGVAQDPDNWAWMLQSPNKGASSSSSSSSSMEDIGSKGCITEIVSLHAHHSMLLLTCILAYSGCVRVCVRRRGRQGVH